MLSNTHARTLPKTTKTIGKSAAAKLLLWPAAGVLAAVLLVAQVHVPGIQLLTGTIAWVAMTLLVPVLAASAAGARGAAFLAGLTMAVAFVLSAPPLTRCLFACCMAIPLANAISLLVSPPVAGFWRRLGHMFANYGIRRAERCARSFDTSLLLRLLGSTVVFGVALAALNASDDLTNWHWPARWLAGGVAVLGFSEMLTVCMPLVSRLFGIALPQLMNSPWRSTSIGEFWSKRWNVRTSEELFRPLCYAPLARRSVALAVVATFGFSAVIHALLANMGTGLWGISLACGAFFMVQPLFIGLERVMRVRRWRPAAGWLWTLAVLAITSPLFVEPLFQTIEMSCGGAIFPLGATFVVLGSTLAASLLITLLSLAGTASRQPHDQFRNPVQTSQ